MQILGRITNVLEPQSGVSQRTGNEWKSQQFVVEFFEEENQRYADKVLLQTFDTRHMEMLAGAEGKECKVWFGHSVREANGRFYNELRIFRMEMVGQQAAEPAKEEPQHPFEAMMQHDAVAATAKMLNAVEAEQEQSDELPF